MTSDGSDIKQVSSEWPLPLTPCIKGEVYQSAMSRRYVLSSNVILYQVKFALRSKHGEDC